MNRIALFAIATAALIPTIASAGFLDRLPFGKDKQIAAEIERMEAREAINEAAWPLLSNPALLAHCDGGRPSYGFSYIGLEGVEMEHKPAYDELGLVPRQIVAVQTGSPAQQAGLLAGDVVLKANGKKLKASYKGDNKLSQIVEDSRDDGDLLTLAIDRAGREITLIIEPVKACDFEAVVGGALGAGGGHTLPRKVRDRAIMVDIALYRLVSTDSAALRSVVVHELAHQFQGHIKARATKAGIGRGLDTVLGMGGIATGGALGMAGGISFKASEELEADSAALSLMDDLGLPRSDYVSLVHRIGSEQPDLMATVVGSHPINADRLAALPEGEG